MTTYVLRNGELVEKSLAAPRDRSGASVHVIRDEMEPTRHMANGKYYTSKAKFRQATRDAGCVEVGTDPAILRPRRSTMPSRDERRHAIRSQLREMLHSRS